MPFEALGGGKEKEKAPRGRPRKRSVPSLRKWIATGAKGLYQIPVLLGHGAHWKLTEEEADAVGDYGEQIVEQLPNKRTQQLMKLADKFGPWIGLCTVLAVSTWIRWEQTKQLREIYANQRGEPAPGRNPEGAGPAGEAPSPSAKNRVSEFLGGGNGTSTD